MLVPLTRCPSALLLAATLVASAGVAQEPHGVLVGTVVVENSGAPIPGALVALDARIRVTADPQGTFRIDSVRPGPYRIAAVTTGCHVAMGEVIVQPGDTVQVRLAVPLTPEAEADLEEWTLGERSRGEAVKVITAEDIQRRNFPTVQDAIRTVAPEMIGQESGQAGGRLGIRPRGNPTVRGTGEPLVIVDGVRLLQRAADALATIRTESVERIEVVKGAAGGWRYGLQGANGVIRIYTRTPGSTHGRATPPEACGFRFPR